MTEQHKPNVGLVIEELPYEYMAEDPRETLVIMGEKIVLGETIFPAKESNPGWSLTPVTFVNKKTDRDGCLFTLAPNNGTPIGLVGEPPNQDLNAHFTEWIIKGSGYLLVESSEGVVQSIEVSSKKLNKYKYGSGTKVAYIAGSEGLEGINIGTPSQIPEDSLSLNDTRASNELWGKYTSLLTGSNTAKKQ